ncbi:MAG: efflux RND transporter permease subunit [Deltaproteobacteria bacterium]|nr:efflux RND transporter permease subunit [Candidatus Anaeroferrophillacea bacterium]
MNYEKLFHSHAAVVFLLVAVIYGAVGIRGLPLNLFPDANYPVVTVVLVWPGAAAAEVEEKLARVAERELATLDGKREVRSVSRDEVASLKVEFDYRRSLDAAMVDVSAALDRVRAALPADILPPRIFRVSDAAIPVSTLAVTPRDPAVLDLAAVRRLADNELREALLRVPDIGQVEVFGGRREEVLVELDPDLLARHGIGTDAVRAALAARQRNQPGGLLVGQRQELRLTVAGEIVFRHQLLDIVVGTGATGPVHLRDVARWRVGAAEPRSCYRGNGEPAVALNILRPESGTVSATLDALARALPRLEGEFPAVEIAVADTQGELITTAVDNMLAAVRDAVILTVAVIFLLLARTRMTLAAACSIPVTFLLTFAGMRLFRFELNIVTLTGIILAVGLLVDDAVVVLENIATHLQKPGADPRRAAIAGTREVMLADFAGTATTIAVLLPVIFVGGYPQRTLRPLSLVLIMALAASYVVSITVIPWVSPRLAGSSGSERRLERLTARCTDWWLKPLTEWFVRASLWARRHRLLLLGPGGLLLLVISLRLMPVAGRDLMPPMDTGIIKITFEAEANRSLAETETLLAAMEREMYAHARVKRISATVGSEPGVVSFGTERTPQEGAITVHVPDRFHRDDSVWEIEARLRDAFGRIPGLKTVHVFDYGATPLAAISAPVAVRISGPDPRRLDRLADEMHDRLRGVRGLTSVARSWSRDRRELVVRFDADRLAAVGLDQAAAARELETAFSGAVPASFTVAGEAGIPVRVRYPAAFRDGISDVATLRLTTPAGPVPVNEVGTVERRWVQTRIVRENLHPMIELDGYRDTMAISHLQGQVAARLKGFVLPPGYELRHAGEIEHMQDSFGRLVGALGLSLLLLYAVLAVTFGSFGRPLVIMGVIPLALVGVSWGMLITGRHFCMPAAMGMILLTGVVVNNAILLLEFVDAARRRGMDREAAIAAGIRQRTRPILMTALSTMVGMLPVAMERALGLERLSPLAVAVIAGLFVATLLTLIYVPLLYTLAEDLGRRFRMAKG